MSNTLKNISLPSNEWVDIYSHPVIVSAGIEIGDKIKVSAISGNMHLNAGTEKPTAASGFEPLQQGFQAINEATDTGAWIKSVGSSGLINVSKA